MEELSKPQCIGCNRTYEKGGSLRFEYRDRTSGSSLKLDYGNRPDSVVFSFALQPYEVVSLFGSVPNDPVRGAPKLGRHRVQVERAESGISFCSGCIQRKPKNQLIEEAYQFMISAWDPDRVPDLEYLKLTAYTSLE